MEKLVIEMPSGNWQTVLEEMKANGFNWKANEDYVIKEVRVEDDFFKDDPTWHTMKKESNDLYKRLKRYEYDQRQKIKK